MKRFLLIGLLCYLVFVSCSQSSNNDYEKDWQQVLNFEDSRLPKSAIKVVEEILEKAIKDKNNTQVIKALIYRSKYKRAIDHRDNTDLLADLHELVQKTGDVGEKALLYSMLAELYVDYYADHSYTIERRTNLSDTVPADMDQWSGNIFVDKIIEHLELSVKAAAKLKQRTTQQYDDIIMLGVDRVIYPTLYDFLMKRAIEITQDVTYFGQGYGYLSLHSNPSGFTFDQLTLPAREYVKLDISPDVDNNQMVYVYYQKYLDDLLRRDMTSTVILTEISKLAFLKKRYYAFSSEHAREAYLRLEKIYEQNDACSEIINQIVKSYDFGYYYRTNDPRKIEAKYDWLKKGIEKYPRAYGTRLLKIELERLENPYLEVQGEEVQHPDMDMQISIAHKNVQHTKERALFVLYRKEGEKYTKVNDFALSLVSKTTYITDTLSLNLGKLPVGSYCFTNLSPDELTSTGTPGYRINKFDFIISGLISNDWKTGDNYTIFVTDRITGKPVKDAIVKVVPDKKKQPHPKILKTNQTGIVTYKDTLDTYTVYKTGIEADTCLHYESFSDAWSWLMYDYDEDSEATRYYSIFTDRGIYRPGQPVQFKAIVIDKRSKPVTGKVFTAKMLNWNDELVSQKDLTSNEFGSIAGEFVLPQLGLPGHYHIRIDGNGDNDNDSYYRSVYFHVEEYKRPTFEITFAKIEETYALGEEVRLKGYARNFSGINIQDADVNYRITRKVSSYWYWDEYYGVTVGQGTMKTGEDGSFEIVFTPTADDTRKAYTFEITADITDTNGETRSNQQSITAGNISMKIDIGIPQQIEKTGHYPLHIRAKNMQGERVETSGTYTVYRLDDNDSIQEKVLDGPFETGEQNVLRSDLKKLASGKYRLQVKAFDSKGNELVEKRGFILFSYADKKPPFKTNEWLVKKDTIFGSGKAAEVIFGVTDEIYVLFQIHNNKKIFEQKIIRMNNENRLFTIPYQTGYGDEVHATFIFVKNARLYNRYVSIKREEKPDAGLEVKLETFRDMLRPGQTETWTISVKGNNRPAVAELLASMYDISLDQIYPYEPWSLNLPEKNKLYPLIKPNNWRYWDTKQKERFRLSNPVDEDPETYFNRFDVLNWFDYIYRPFEGYVNEPTGPIAEITPPDMAIKSSSSLKTVMRSDHIDQPPPPPPPPPGTTDPSDEVASDDVDTKNIESFVPPQIRRNFNETAFFYPRLRTNEKGEVLISFTVPESNTTWRFRTLAHDRNARIGRLERLVTTRKELMVTPNMPRFIRQGDKTGISTKISNLSDQSVSGHVTIEFFDPGTDKPIKLDIPDQKQDFHIEAGASVSAGWTFNVPDGIELAGCRIVAQTETFSDGEQHVLPVLSNRMLVTESMPIDMPHAGTSTFTFEKLRNNQSSSIENYKLTLEYASNPAWYAIQALPLLSNPSGENSVNWLAAYYVNRLGTSIVKQYPKVAAMIDSWKKQGGDEQSLVSKLQKDESLKTILLEETPWVMDAKSETEQMQQLSAFFDLTRAQGLADAATGKLLELQKSDGGWSWYKGMESSRGITQYILYGYATLKQATDIEYPDQVKRMQTEALKYIDKQILENFNEQNKSRGNTTTISTNQLEYLYVRSFYEDVPMDSETLAAKRHYTNVASSNWKKLNLYEWSLLAVLLQRNGNKDLATKIAASIREYAINDEKLGMYWPNNRNRVFLSMSSVCKHVFLMDALIQTGSSTEEVNMMKRWLLKQKQTQQWESTHATIDAIHALLIHGDNWFAGETVSANITVGGQLVDTGNKEMGTGYFKTTWDEPDMDNQKAVVKVEQKADQPAYGAMYWQYYENLNKITVHQGVLNIEKQLFKEINTATGKELERLKSNNTVIVGDKIVVRLVIKTDRDMEFVLLKDMRASCFEPQQTLSGIRRTAGLIFYQTTRDASTNFYFDLLPKGTYVLEYPAYATRSGEYANGITTIQCMYAPEFTSHTQGIKIIVKDRN